MLDEDRPFQVTSCTAREAKVARPVLEGQEGLAQEGLLYTGDFPRSAAPEPNAASSSLRHGRLCGHEAWYSRGGGGCLGNKAHVSLFLIKT